MHLPSLTNRALRAYVLSLPPDQPVGQRKDGQRCLVAQYLRHGLEAAYPHLMHITVNECQILISVFDEHGYLMAGAYRRPSLALQRVIEGFDCLGPAWPLPKDVLPLLEERS